MTIGVMGKAATSTEERAERYSQKIVPTMRTQVVTAPSGRVCAEKLGPIAHLGKALGWVVAFVTASTSNSASARAATASHAEAGNRISAFSEIVDEMKGLDIDWNGYGSSPPNEFAREVAKQILLTAMSVVVPDRITASAQGGVGICFTFRNKYADIECLNTGEILATTSDGRAVPEVWEVKPNDTKGALERIVRFLNS
jgi:hypothetical protein